MTLISVICLYCQDDPRVDECICWSQVRKEDEANVPYLYETDDGTVKPKWCEKCKYWEVPD